jgi:hypothetical protein
MVRGIGFVALPRQTVAYVAHLCYHTMNWRKGRISPREGEAREIVTVAAQETRAASELWNEVERRKCEAETSEQLLTMLVTLLMPLRDD